MKEVRTGAKEGCSRLVQTAGGCWKNRSPQVTPLGQMRHMAYKPFVPDASPVSDDGVQSTSRGCRGVEYVSVLPWLGIPVSGYCVCKQKRGVR